MYLLHGAGTMPVLPHRTRNLTRMAVYLTLWEFTGDFGILNSGCADVSEKAIFSFYFTVRCLKKSVYFFIELLCIHKRCAMAAVGEYP